MAKLYFRHGVMAAAKTSNLLQVDFTYTQAGMRTILAKPAIDSKGASSITSRIGLSKEADLLITEDYSLKREIPFTLAAHRVEGNPVACLLIDEAQFLTEKQVDELMWLAVYEDLPVLAYGLRTDFQTKVFPGSSRLLAIAHSVEEIKTVCPYDGTKALFNARKNSQGEFIREGGQIAIDGELVTYEALCPKCYMEKVKPLGD